MNAILNILHNVADKIFLTLCNGDQYLMILRGLRVSLILTAVAAVIGIGLGLVLAVCRLSGKGPLYSLSGGYISFIRGVPMAVFLVLIFFGLLAKAGLPEMLVASIAFGLNSAAYVAEIIRAGIAAIDKGQMEAGRSLGLSYLQCMRHIVVPQAVKNVLPALGNEFITLLKETSIASFIGIADLNRAATDISAITYDAFIAPMCVAYIYFLLTTLLSTGVGAFERRLRQSD